MAPWPSKRAPARTRRREPRLTATQGRASAHVSWMHLIDHDVRRLASAVLAEREDGDSSELIDICQQLLREEGAAAGGVRVEDEVLDGAASDLSVRVEDR